MLGISAYREGVESNFPVTPKFCPICGHDSIRRVTRREILNLYRCGDGHFFIFDSEPEPKEETEKN
jgi:predicted RNA-binding Zn-ribbon protein involved in translation (DUF1610 family)